MTPEQEELREERTAILIFDAGLTEDQAKRHIASMAEIYGITPITEKQEGLFK